MATLAFDRHQYRENGPWERPLTVGISLLAVNEGRDACLAFGRAAAGQAKLTSLDLPLTLHLRVRTLSNGASDTFDRAILRCP
ncbi:MAG: hypothetical protein OWU33_09800 [Firmicutes bacterium]|nr:hypothetical protein [Bacillota bacterium]